MPCRGKGICCMVVGVKKSREPKSFLCATLLLDLIYVPIKYYQVISNSMGFMAGTRFRHQISVHNGESKSTLEHNKPTGPY